jgi:oligosaccharide repeat unit polymerase
LRSDIYYTLTEKNVQYTISASALIFIFINFLIYNFPLLHYKNKADYIIAPSRNIIVNFTLFIGIIAIIPFIENLLVVLNMDTIFMETVYYDKMDENFDSHAHFSLLGRYCNGLVNWFSYIIPVLFFYVLTIHEHKKKLIICLCFLAILNPVLMNITYGGRNALFQTLCLLIFNYLLFYKYLTSKQKTIITITGMGIGGCFVLALLFITFSRSDLSSNIVLENIYRYLGEGFVNFSEKGWFIEHHTGGYSCFNGTGHTFLRHISDLFESRDYVQLSGTTNMRMYVFYTVFGDFYIDFGIIGGIFTSVVFAFLLFWTVRKKQSNLSSLILLNLYVKIGLTGIYCYAYMNFMEFLLFSLFIVCIIRHLERKNCKYIKY